MTLTTHASLLSTSTFLTLCTGPHFFSLSTRLLKRIMLPYPNLLFLLSDPTWHVRAASPWGYALAIPYPPPKKAHHTRARQLGAPKNTTAWAYLIFRSLEKRSKNTLDSAAQRGNAKDTWQAKCKAPLDQPLADPTAMKCQQASPTAITANATSKFICCKKSYSLHYVHRKQVHLVIENLLAVHHHFYTILIRWKTRIPGEREKSRNTPCWLTLKNAWTNNT